MSLGESHQFSLPYFTGPPPHTQIPHTRPHHTAPCGDTPLQDFLPFKKTVYIKHLKEFQEKKGPYYIGSEKGTVFYYRYISEFTLVAPRYDEFDRT